MKNKILLINFIILTLCACEKKSEKEISKYEKISDQPYSILYDSAKNKKLKILDTDPNDRKALEIGYFLSDLDAKGYNAIRINQSGHITIIDFNLIFAREKNAPPVIRGDDSERIQRLMDMDIELELPSDKEEQGEDK